MKSSSISFSKSSTSHTSGSVNTVTCILVSPITSQTNSNSISNIILLSLIFASIQVGCFLILAIAIKLESKGPVFYRQIRVTQYNKRFRIFKFRTMRQDADKGSLITVDADDRITRVGRLIRNCRLDEISQLLDVLRGTMTFVSVRAEVPKFTEQYTKEMMATLLLPAGVTSLASILYKNEAELLRGVEDTDKAYIETILPKKMQ